MPKVNTKVVTHPPSSLEKKEIKQAPAKPIPQAPQEEVPEAVKTFRSLSLDLALRGTQAHGSCPFCGKERKFAVVAASGKWNCFACGRSGNPTTFLRQLHEESMKLTTDWDDLAADRRLLYSETLLWWGACRSLVDGEWLVPAFGTGGKLDQLSRWLVDYEREDRKRRLMPTAGLGLAMHAAQPFNAEASDVFICEGAWNGMALWECLRNLREVDGHVVPLEEGGTEADSLLADAAVVAVPGANVFSEHWRSLFSGKRVTLVFDNDHPRPRRDKDGKVVVDPTTGQPALREGAGLAGARRTARILASGKTPPLEVRWIRWGPDPHCHDPELPDGHDVRDALAEGGPTLAGRIPKLRHLLSKVEEVPVAWLQGTGTRVGFEGGELTPATCTNWSELLESWRRAMRWRQGMEDVLAVMLAVTVSTEQVGDQLFLQVVGDPGGGKTRFCDAMLVSRHCHALEHFTGFHSGTQDGSGEDFSLIARINRKTLVTPEGDVLVSSPNFLQLMSQQRRIFDGTSGATYKNRKEDLRYTGLRTPWILAGTPSRLMNMDQSRVGDRFIRVFYESPSEVEKGHILSNVISTAIRSVRQQSNGAATGQMDGNFVQAYRLTGGYVDFLRENGPGLLQEVSLDEREMDRCCSSMAQFTADMRARPDPDRGKFAGDIEVAAGKEMPNRLGHQFARLALCLAVVRGTGAVDRDVLRTVAKVALDTSRGRVYDLCRLLLARARTEGIGTATLAGCMEHGWGEDRAAKMLGFLRSIGVAEVFRKQMPGGTTRERWRLTERSERLWKTVHGYYKG